MQAIAVDRLSKRYGSTIALDGVSFRAIPGRVTGFLGPNGAGKTTTLRILVGLAAPTSGSATIAGVPFRDLPDPARTVGALVDRAGFHPGLAARRQLLLLGGVMGASPARVDGVLGLTGLADAGHRRVGEFSLGMRQRLALAAALLADPPVLVLDEPANGLDPPGLRWLRDLLRAMAGEGRTVLVSSHQLAEMAMVADDLVVVSRGKVVRAGSVTQLTKARVVARSPSASVLAQAVGRAGLEASVKGDVVEVADTTPEVVGEAAAAVGIVLHELRLESSSVEDVFFASVEPTAGNGHGG